MNPLKIISIFLILPFSYLIGFFSTSFSMGFYAGRKSAEAVAKKCYEDSQARGKTG